MGIDKWLKVAAAAIPLAGTVTTPLQAQGKLETPRLVQVQPETPRQNLEGAERWLRALEELGNAENAIEDINTVIEKLRELNQKLRERLNDNIPEHERKSLIDQLEKECRKNQNSLLLKNARDIVDLLKKQKEQGALSPEENQRLGALFGEQSKIIEQTCTYHGS